MAVGRFLLVLHSHMPYVLSHGKSPHGTDWIHESAAECYLPLLDVLDRLLKEGIKPRWTVNISPILAEQLDDPSFQSEFEEYCQHRIDGAEADLQQFERDGDLGMQGLAAMWKRFFTRDLVQFKHVWNRSIVQAFRYFQDQGSIEIITCAATHGYLPLLEDDQAVRAQVRIGVETYRKRFDRAPRGIWIPECAYRPAYEWKPPVGDGPARMRASVDQILAEEGIEYFFVDSHMIRGGEPLGTYGAKFPQLAEMFARSSKFFEPTPEQRSEYEPYVLESGVTIFARDPETTVKVWSGDVGYPGDPSYLEFHKQLYPTRLRYWRISEMKSDLGAKQPYDPWNAYEKIGAHAQDFVQTLKGTLSRYRGSTNKTGSLVAMYDTELFGHWWWEGPEFLYETARAIARDGEIDMVSAGDVIDHNPATSMIRLPEGSWGEGGYHYIWLNDQNSWTWERLYPAERRLLNLIGLEPKGDALRVVQQAARELLLAEASDWQFLISTWAARDYAEARFSDHLDRFDRLANLAVELGQSGVLKDVDLTFVEDCEQKDAAFKDVDLDWWLAPARDIAHR